MTARSLALASTLDPTRGPGRLLRLSFVALALVVSVKSTLDSFAVPIWGVDIVVPLRAAQRWLDGGQPYLASSFQAGSGYDVPYLYPPLFLPILAPLTKLPIELVIVVANVGCMLAAYAACRRLGIAPWATALLLLWPPFSGAIAGGNLAVPIFAAFVLLYWDRRRDADGVVRTEPRRFEEHEERAGSRVRDGILGAIVPTIKISQAHAWVGLLRVRPLAALVGLAIVAGVALALLPFTGPQLWFDWLAQLGRAADPAWSLGGAGLARGAPAVVSTGLALVSMAAVFVVPRGRIGAWIGLLTVVGSPGLRHYSLVFALPAMLEVRMELALIAGLLIASYTLEGLWAGIAIVVLAYLLSGRLPALREPVSRVTTGPAGSATGPGETATA